MLKKCPIIKHCAFANTGIVTGLLSKFKPVGSLGLNYRPITLDFSQNYKEQGRRQTRCTCRRFQKSLAGLLGQERRQRRRGRIEQLWFQQNRSNDWQVTFLTNIVNERKLYPKQLNKLAEIEAQLLGGVES